MLYHKIVLCLILLSLVALALLAGYGGDSADAGQQHLYRRLERVVRRQANHRH
jgi:hypothetical protein